MFEFRLDHIQLAMPPGEADKARAFFVGLLGFDEEPKPEPLASRGGCWFRHGDVMVHLGVEAEFSPQKKAHPAFTVRPLEALADRLKEHDYPVKWDRSIVGCPRFFSTDPFGNRMEFLARDSSPLGR